MKAAIVIAQGIKQVMLSPESEEEKFILSAFTKDQAIDLEIKTGSFVTMHERVGYEIGMCKGGHLRAFSNDDCVMLVLKPKEDSTKK